MKEHYKVYFSPDDIKLIRADTGEAVLGWHEDEWIEDPQVVFSIVNAVLEAVRYPKLFNSRLERLNEDRQSHQQGCNT